MSKNRKESCNLHLYLGKKDLEILRWKESLPPRCFKYYMEQILLSYVTGQKIMIPAIKEGKTEPSIRPIHLVITNKTIIEFLEQFDNGEKSKSIKEILNYYIREAKDGQYISRGKKAKKAQAPIYEVPQNIQTQSEHQNKKPVSKQVEKVQPSNHNNSDNNDTKSSKPNVPQITVEKPKAKDNTSKNEKKQQPVDTKNPMVQALFRMSGDE